MKLTPRPRLKTSDVHLRINKNHREMLNKICVIKETTITQLFEKYIQEVAQHHNII
jgi:hypothetical protein